jgi:hypothetical protein
VTLPGRKRAPAPRPDALPVTNAVMLEEPSYRFNRRWRETERIGFVLNRAVHCQPFSYSRLTAERFG